MSRIVLLVSPPYDRDTVGPEINWDGLVTRGEADVLQLRVCGRRRAAMGVFSVMYIVPVPRAFTTSTLHHRIAP
ncbi:hypothetical protein GGI54_006772 [Rhizobium leguminosarum]|nr:hypothetical protein [Rhizobium leguminosarum]